MLPVSGEEIDDFKAMLEDLGWSFHLDGPDLKIIVGGTPDGLTQHDCWQFINEELHPRLRLAAVKPGAMVH